MTIKSQAYSIAEVLRIKFLWAHPFGADLAACAETNS